MAATAAIAAHDRTAAVVASDLTKRYGNAVAVDNIDLQVPTGGCFGVLGPNGAGKTTTMRMIACVSPITSGSLHVLGQDVAGNRRAIKRRIGVVPQGQTLDDDLTVRENLTSFGAYHDLPRRTAGQRADELLDFVQLSHRADADVEALSGGMQRRVLIARALVNDPELVILDEPTTGLDPQARHLVWDRLRSLRGQGKTLLLTTHYMDEAAQLCDYIVVMDRGVIIAAGTPGALVDAHAAPRVVEIRGTDATESDLRTVLAEQARDIEVRDDRAFVYGDDGERMIGRIRDAGVPNAGLLLRDATLEDVFLRLTGRALVE